jgi:hypothetical protein
VFAFLLLAVLERPARGGKEHLFEGLHAVLPLELSGRRETDEPAAIENADPGGERFGLAEVVVQRRTVASCVDRISLMMSRTSRRERGSSPVVGSSSKSKTGAVRRARASATFCCMPRERFSIGSRRRFGGKPTRSRISGIRGPVAAGVIP